MLKSFLVLTRKIADFFIKYDMKKKFCCFIIFVLLFVVSCSKKEIHVEPVEEKTIPVKKIDKNKVAIENFMLSLSDEQIITQLFAIGLDGNDVLHSYAKEEFESAAPGFFLLFKANMAQTAEEVLDFTRSVYTWFAQNSSNVPPLMLIDNEGGLVYRFEDIGSPLLSHEKMTQFFSAEEAQTYFSLIAKQMSALNVHVNLAPLVEVKNDENALFLGNRSFGDLEKTISYGKAFVTAFENENIASVIKHFPGNTNVDPHDGLPHLSISQDEFFDSYIKSFEEILKDNPSGVLMSHIVVDLLDEGVPACLSNVIVQEILRERLKYEGVIMSDDLFMGALKQNGYEPEKAVIEAINAGVDILMMSEKRYGTVYDSVYEKYKNDSSFMKKCQDSCERILKLKLKLNLMEVIEIVDDSGTKKLTLKAKELAPKEEQLNKFNQAKDEAVKFFNSCVYGK